jgi:hypothetical protein
MSVGQTCTDNCPQHTTSVRLLAAEQRRSCSSRVRTGTCVASGRRDQGKEGEKREDRVR